MYTDPIADLLTRIRNATKARHTTVTLPHSKIKTQILEVMKSKQFISDFEVFEENKFKMIKIDLNENRQDISLKRVSKPGQRIYIKKAELKPTRSGLGLRILSTSRGVMSDQEAKKQNIGGELLCELY